MRCIGTRLAATTLCAAPGLLNVRVVLRRREYVARILVGAIPGMSQADAYLVMQKAHKQGMAVVGVWVFEVAEAYCDKLKSGGLIASVTEED